ncbi:MAG: SUMF1/EgtB/PvdO family nonheme iron enzyme [Culturomica sp.]|jgi:formylglycine-generating enzyme required for sulfatase activity|nr:SUMF1/EgtB/PvdO family nonheme iron enzyme [Culturomica sp.]
MRISLLSVFLILFSFGVRSQEMTITEFKEFPMDMDAKLNYPKKNLNDGELFAIIKVETSLKCEDFQLFDFGSVGNGDIDCSNGLWIYAPATATKLSITHKLAGTIVNHLLPMQLKPATVYKMVIESGRQISRIEETLNYGYLVVKSNVDGSLFKISQNGNEIKSDYISTQPKTMTLAPGQYTYTVEVVDYETERGVFTIKNEESSNLTANLRSSMGSLSVNSSPEQGAYVNINGKRQERTTPATFPLRKGNYQITVYKDLYKQAESTVTVSAGEQAVYNAVLSANFAEVAVDAPAGAYVYIDGNQSGEGKWAGRLEAGMHTVEVEKASHVSFKTSVNLVNGEKKLVSVPPLTPIYGKLNVVTDPVYASVVIDGIEQTSKTPCVVKDVLVGDRKVKLVPASSEYETFETMVNISEGKITNLNKTFTKKPKAVAATVGSDFTDSRSNQVTRTHPGEPEMIAVKGGTFTMGSSSGDNDEKPVHSVTVSDFKIGKYEVTQAQWRAVMGSNPSYFKGDNLPVEKVSWDDCQEFIRKLNAATGKNYRLPTEAEWEYAARGGSRSNGYEYSGSNTLGDVAWYDSNSGNETHPVGRKKPNELGIYDMSGNVWEWCSDWYGSYSSGSQTNPKGAASGSYRVYRGGSWYGNAARCRVAFRHGNSPDDRRSILGFRLVLP